MSHFAVKPFDMKSAVTHNTPLIFITCKIKYFHHFMYLITKISLPNLCCRYVLLLSNHNSKIRLILYMLYQPLCLVVLREVWEKSRGYCQHQFRVCMTCLKYPSVGANQHFLSMQIFLGNSAMQKFLQYVNEQEADVDVVRINRISQQPVVMPCIWFRLSSNL